MRKVGMTLAAAIALVAAGTGTASAGEVTPCATQQAVFDKYGIGLNMHQEQVEAAYCFVCSKTG